MPRSTPYLQHLGRVGLMAMWLRAAGGCRCRAPRCRARGVPARARHPAHSGVGPAARRSRRSAARPPRPSRRSGWRANLAKRSMLAFAQHAVDHDVVDLAGAISQATTSPARIWPSSIRFATSTMPFSTPRQALETSKTAPRGRCRARRRRAGCGRLELLAANRPIDQHADVRGLTPRPPAPCGRRRWRPRRGEGGSHQRRSRMPVRLPAARAGCGARVERLQASLQFVGGDDDRAAARSRRTQCKRECIS